MDPDRESMWDDYWYYYYRHRRRIIEEDIAYRERIHESYDVAHEERTHEQYYMAHRDRSPTRAFRYRDVRAFPDDTAWASATPESNRTYKGHPRADSADEKSNPEEEIVARAKMFGNLEDFVGGEKITVREEMFPIEDELRRERGERNEGMEGEHWKEQRERMEWNEKLEGEQWNEQREREKWNEGMEGDHWKEQRERKEWNMKLEGEQWNEQRGREEWNKGMEGEHWNEQRERKEWIEKLEGDQRKREEWNKRLDGEQGNEGLEGEQWTEGLEGEQWTEGLEGEQWSEGLEGEQWYEHMAWEEGHDPTAGWSDGGPAHPKYSGAVKGERKEEMEAEGLSTEEKQSLITFKLKRATAIPLCYLGPHFDSRYSEFIVQVFPVSYSDIWKSSFSAITANASSVMLNLGNRKGYHRVKSCLTLMANRKDVRKVMRAVVTHNFLSQVIIFKVEQRRPAEEPIDEAGEPIFFPKVIARAAFKVKKKDMQVHLRKMKTGDKTPDEKQSVLGLHNLPKCIGWRFLQVLFPLAMSGQVIEGEPNSAFLKMGSGKLALLHLVSITDLHINGQAVHLHTDQPPDETMQILQRMEKETRQKSSKAADQPKKKRKQLSPSDILRMIRKKREYTERIMKSYASSIHAPSTSGIPSLLSMTFPQLGNTAGLQSKAPPSASASSWNAGQNRAPWNIAPHGRDSGKKIASSDGGEQTEDFSEIPIPQLLEGPYPSVSEYCEPGQRAPGTSQKVRTRSYFCRQGARLGVHLAHLFGGNIELAGKELARCLLPENTRPPPACPPAEMLSVAPLTEAQLKRLKKKLKGNVSMEQMKKAEEYWQRQRRKKLEMGVSTARNEWSGETTEKSHKKILRDRKRMTEFNKQKEASLSHRTSTEDKGNTTSGNNQAAATAKHQHTGFQRYEGVSTKSEGWDKQQASNRSSPVQSVQQSYQYHPPAKHPPPPPPPPPPPLQQQQYGGQNKSHKPPLELMPPPPLPPFRLIQTAQSAQRPFPLVSPTPKDHYTPIPVTPSASSQEQYSHSVLRPRGAQKPESHLSYPSPSLSPSLQHQYPRSFQKPESASAYKPPEPESVPSHKEWYLQQRHPGPGQQQHHHQQWQTLERELSAGSRDSDNFQHSRPQQQQQHFRNRGDGWPGMASTMQQQKHGHH